MNIEITDAVIVAVIVGLVEMAKGMGLPVRLPWFYLLSLVSRQVLHIWQYGTLKQALCMELFVVLLHVGYIVPVKVQ
ncbi:hypothetical protein ABNF16_21140 [Paenibacillus larvae]